MNNPSQLIKSPGFTLGAIEVIRKRGYSLEANQPSELAEINVFNAYRKIAENNSQLKKKIRRLTCNRYDLAFPSIAAGAVSDILFNTQRDVLKSLNKLNCGERKKFNLETGAYANQVHTPLESMKFWNGLLDEEMPFAISYNVKVLTDERILDKAHEIPKIQHASLVIGRRFNKEKKVCKFLVRNTYKKGDIEMNQQYTPDGENVWVKAIDLVKSTSFTTYIEPE